MTTSYYFWLGADAPQPEPQNAHVLDYHVSTDFAKRWDPEYWMRSIRGSFRRPLSEHYGHDD